MESEPKRAFVAGPYRGKHHRDVRRNIESARAVAEWLWEHHYNVFCPHLNSAWMSGVCPEKWFMEGALDLLTTMDLVVMADGWVDSDGSRKEYERAKDLGIPIYRIKGNRLEKLND